MAVREKGCFVSKERDFILFALREGSIQETLHTTHTLSLFDVEGVCGESEKSKSTVVKISVRRCIVK